MTSSSRLSMPDYIEESNHMVQVGSTRCSTCGVPNKRKESLCPRCRRVMHHRTNLHNALVDITKGNHDGTAQDYALDCLAALFDGTD